MTQPQLLDLLERAYEAGCFKEVMKMIKAGSGIVLIEKVIEKSKKRHDEFNLDWSDLFGAD
tara:strand:+ start:297 stop:479 length:183 start_codon:yes stop_codon:yes gene_type:complete